jgi:uncharacterized membrane protein YfcA
VLDLLNGGLGWPVAGALVAVSFVASFITAAFGIGGGLVMLASLASLLPAPAIIPVHGLVQLGSNGGRAAMLWKYFPAGLLLPFSIGAAIGVAIGGSVVVALSPGAIKLGLGLFILWTLFFKPPAILRRSVWLVGVVSSFLTMFFGGTGPFVASYLRTRDFERRSYVAAQGVLMTVQHGLKTLTFGILGFAFSHWAGFTALLIAAGLAGTYTGRAVLHRLDDRVFHRVLNVLLGLLALRLIWDGATTLWH